MAKLGKAVKGKSKKKKAAGGDDKEAALLAKVAEMEQADYRRKLALQTRKMLKERLTKEREMTAVNAKKVKNGWLKIMRLAAVDSLRRDVEIISQNHERDVDRRDALLQMLDRDIDEAEEQFQMALREHLVNLDKLIELQDTRLQALEMNFEQDLEELEKEFDTEREKIVQKHGRFRTELLDVIDAVQSQENYKATESKQEFEQLREEIRNKNIEEINVLSAALDQQIEELERHFESAHLNYLQNTDKRTEEFKKLTRADNTKSRNIEQSIRSIERLQASLAQWKVKIVQNSRDYNSRNQMLAEEKAAMAGHVAKLKKKMQRYRSTQSQRLTDLSADVRETKKAIEQRMVTAERILELAEVARKHESDEEKVQPFYYSAEGGEGEEEKEAPMKADEDEDRAAFWLQQVFKEGGVEGEAAERLGKYIPEGEVKALDRFMKRFNKVLLSKIALEREQAALQHENQQLQSVLKQFLEGISVTADVLSGPNPLLVINGQSNTLPPPVRPEAAHVTVVESNHMMATGRVAGMR